MTTLWRMSQLFLASLAFLLSAAVVLLGFGLAELTPGFIPRPLIPLCLVVLVGVPTLVCWWIARALGRRWGLVRVGEVFARYPALGRGLALAYLVTAVFGIPATLSQQNEWAVAEYKRLRASGSRQVWEAHPYIASYGALPVLPGVVLSYHEYQLAGLYGGGSFELTVWYGTGVVSVGVFPMWVS